MESFLSKWRNEKSWIPVPGGRDSDSDIEKTLLENTSAETSSRGSLETGEIYTPRHSSNSRYARFPQGWLFLTAINLLMLVASLLNWKGIWRGLERNPCLKETSYYSPILDAQDIALHEVRMNGTLFPPTDPSWSRLPFGDPVGEAMWESFERVPPFPITREQVVALGKDPETVARLEDDYWGMGDDMYIASLDIQHKVHCLNELRKMAFADFGDDAPKKKTHGQLWWIHLRHCTDMLAQDMLCHADADLVTYNWIDTQSHPFPDFSINKKCRNVEDLIAYRDAHSLDMEKYMRQTKPKDAHQVPMDPGWYAMFGFRWSDLYPNGEGAPPLPDPKTWFGDPYKNIHHANATEED